MTWVCEWCRRNDPFIREHIEECELRDCPKHKRAWHWPENPLSLVTVSQAGADFPGRVNPKMETSRMWMGPFNVGL